MTNGINYKALFGATGIPSELVNKNGKITEIGDYKNLDTDNRFKRYQQLYTFSPYIYMAFNKLGLNLVKNIRFEGKKNLVKNFEKWSEEISLVTKLQSMARLVSRDGTYVALITDDKPETFDFEPLLMSQITMLPEGVDINTMPNTILMPPISQIVVNESNTTDIDIYRPENVFICSFCPREKVQEDAIGRDTFGLYGISLMDSVTDIFLKYVDLVSGYTNYIKRYGIGRYHIDYSMLTDLIISGQLSIEEAIEIMQDLAQEHTEIKENEDIVGAGFSVKQLEAGSANIDVTGFKKSLETDIQIGLLQSPVTMGQTQGSTFASAYVSEDDRLLALEGLQLALMSALNSKDGIIGKRLIAMGKKPGDVKILFEELSRPKITEQGMYNALMAGVIAESEYRKFIGFSEAKPENVEYIKQETEMPTGKEDAYEKTLEDGSPDNYGKYPSEE